MSLDQCRRETTHRQFLLWMEYFEQERNTPNKTDHYLMQIALEVRLAIDSFGKKNHKRSLSDFLIKFNRIRKPDSVSLSKEEKQKKLATSKSAWFGATQYKDKW